MGNGIWKKGDDNGAESYGCEIMGSDMTGFGTTGSGVIGCDQIKTHYDIVVVGGGITGAGIFLKAASMGFSVVLMEQNDFAWGTSSRSSKMVHGGLRYLKQGKLLLTRNSVKERERLLRVFPGLVEPLEFIMPVYKGHGPSKMTMELGLCLYSLMALKKQHRGLTRNQTLKALPFINKKNLTGGFVFTDAQVDDARLVLRIISQGCARGGSAFNYTRVCSIDRNFQGRVVGVTARDSETGQSYAVKASVVINATGVFAERLHPLPEKGLHLRPLRGSHLIFSGDVFPFDRVVSFVHPRDQRPVFIFPWKGCAVLGTTDLDHGHGLDAEPFIQREEAEYLMEGAAFAMPGLKLDRNRCISSMAGVRPVLSRRKKGASNESRDHVVWKDKGLVTVTGGKLTTFGLVASDALKAAIPFLPQPGRKKQVVSEIGLVLDPDGFQGVAGETSPSRLADGYSRQIVFAAKHERVRHLSDLLLRRTRLGIVLPQGGRAVLDEIEKICRPILNWDDKRWNHEHQDYLKLWNRFYSSPF